MNKILKKLFLFFKVKSVKHLAKIFIIFGLAGSLSLYLSEYLYDLFNFKKFINTYIVNLFFKIIFLIFIYQFTLISIAIIFGEFKYFIKFFVKFLNRLKF